MNWSNKYLIIIVLHLLLIQCGVKHSAEMVNDDEIVHQSKYLIEAAQLLPIIDHDTLAILDLQRIEDYQVGHLPNAINIWRSELTNSSYEYDGMLPEKAMLEAIMKEKGVSANAFIVLYDNRGSCEATRLWWILKHYGYDKLAILNGGVQGWKTVDTLTTRLVDRKSGTFSLPDQFEDSNSSIEINELASSDVDHQFLIIDTRSKSEYEGSTLKSGARWKGRIPNSMHMDWLEAVDTETYRFKEIADLQEIYKELLHDKRTKVTYCHSGVRSTHTYFILTELLGHKNVKNYDGSWVEWTHHFEPELVN